MMWSTAIGFLVGLLAGAIHLLLLWRAAQPPFRKRAAVPLRLLGVATLLVAGALMGYLFPMAIGWAAGFIIMAVWTLFWKTA